MTTASTSTRLVSCVLVFALVVAGVPATAVATDGRPSAETPAGTPYPGDDTVAVVITFVDDDARDAATFADSPVTVTGGRDVDVTPVLFAEAPRSAIPVLESRSDVAAVAVDRRLDPTPVAPAGTDDGEGAVSTAAGDRVPWGVDRIGARRAASRVDTDSLSSVQVAVVDTGVDYTHPDLRGRVTWGVNVTHGTERYGREAAMDRLGHGTAVAGIVAANADGSGLVGVAPGVELYAVKTISDGGSGRLSWLIRGIDAAVEGPDGRVGTADDADVVQMSLGTQVDHPGVARAVADASDHAVLVASAGNDGDGSPATDEVDWPAASPGTIAVAATNRSDATTRFSSDGPQVTVAAPGTDVEATVPGGTATFTGTSASAPHVAGSVALLLAAADAEPDTTLTPSGVGLLLADTATDIDAPGEDGTSGAGLVRVDRAVAAVQDGSATRSVTSDEVTPGGEVTVTVRTTVSASRVTLTERFDAPVAGASIESVETESDRGSVVLQAADQDAMVAVVQDLSPGQAVTVTYTVRLAESATPGETHAIAGSVTTGVQRRVPATTLTVVRAGNRTAVDRYDGDGDGTISLAELGRAARDYSDGDIDLPTLSTVAGAYADREAAQA